jgi:hypothetical protein
LEHGPIALFPREIIDDSFCLATQFCVFVSNKEFTVLYFILEHVAETTIIITAIKINIKRFISRLKRWLFLPAIVVILLALRSRRFTIFAVR